MRELSLNVLDIVQNSIAAKATLVEVEIFESDEQDCLRIVIRDNGCGMTEEQLLRVRDPFYTTRTTRRVGMGIPLFRMAAEMTDGTFFIDSAVGTGTVVTAVFRLNHIDRMPLGDMAGTMVTLIRLNHHVDFRYRQEVNGRIFEADTRSFREILGDVPLNEPEIIEWIDGFFRENIQALHSRA